jgi:hypothetical protein
LRDFQIKKLLLRRIKSAVLTRANHKQLKMDAGPGHSYQHEIKYAILLVKKGNQDRMLQAYGRLSFASIG